MEYRGVLISVDGYMNVQMANAEEYIEGTNTGALGEMLIRCNNILYIGGAEDSGGSRQQSQPQQSCRNFARASSRKQYPRKGFADSIDNSSTSVSPTFPHVYAGLVGVINSKFAVIGELTHLSV
ncbi:unnamed protein product, partial [Mesorhabditis belari]|uniref:Sm protein F n=1 Tax=Mesorhabditis belari TaxID=2138241 RepID=A0AAF3ERJ3_9BILA